MRVTRFPARAAGPADRMADFIAHLRMNGLRVGPNDTGQALSALSHVDATDADVAREALAAVLASDADEYGKFDDLFDAFWFNVGKQKTGQQNSNVRVQSIHSPLWKSHLGQETEDGIDDGEQAPTKSGDGEAEGTDGKLIATKTRALTRRDLRELMDEATLAEAEKVAQRIGNAIRDHRSRRRKMARRGSALDLRRIQRASMQTGGDPVRLFRRNRPPRPMQVVALCDVSGSMTVYSRVFLAFLKGMVASHTKTDAYLFHTRLIRVTDALTDNDTLRAAARLSLMAEGFGGGTDIAGSLNQFLNGYGVRALNGRTIVVILSDGYCTTDAAALGDTLAKLKRKTRRIVWLNPLAGWDSYEPVAAAIRAARPHIDAHLPANTLADLAALEPQFAQL